MWHLSFLSVLSWAACWALVLLQVRWLDVSGMDWRIIEALAHEHNIHPLVGTAAGAAALQACTLRRADCFAWQGLVHQYLC